MLWLALSLPWLPLEALAPSPTPVARCVVEQRRVLLANRAAREAGVDPGLSASTAASLAPQVQQLVREPAREAAFVQLLALALSSYTPQVVTQGDGVLLEVSASLRLFGGLRSLLRQVRETARECGAHARIGIAPTAEAATLLARIGRPQRALRPARMQRLLDALPLPEVLAVLQPDDERLAELMQAIGCRSVGALRALPRSGVQRRGGRALLAALDRAYGDAPDPQRWLALPERFAMKLELMHRADDAAQLVFGAQRLVQALAGWLSAQWLAASRLSLHLRHERGRRMAGDEPPLAGRRPLGGAARSALGAFSPDSQVLVELGAPSRDATQILTLLRERLQRVALPAPVYEIELRLDDAVSFAGHASQLLPDPGQQAQDFQALLDRLASRLGPERVLRLSTADDHRPERASIAVPAGPSGHRGSGFAGPLVSPPGGSAEGASGGSLPRPVWLLPQPLRLRERNGLPMHGGVLTLLSRAERIEAGWFDGALVCRDYHVAQGPDHRLRWIYRERGAAGESAWYLHGLFC